MTLKVMLRGRYNIIKRLIRSSDRGECNWARRRAIGHACNKSTPTSAQATLVGNSHSKLKFSIFFVKTQKRTRRMSTRERLWYRDLSLTTARESNLTTLNLSRTEATILTLALRFLFEMVGANF